MNEPFQMQVGWCETSSGKRRHAICRIPDDITKREYPWIVVSRNGDIFLHADDGRRGLFVEESRIVKHLPDCTDWDWQPVVRSAKPQPGEWWRHANGDILLIHGFTRQKLVIYEDKNGWSGTTSMDDRHSWQHEPECTGFDWKPKQ